VAYAKKTSVLNPDASDESKWTVTDKDTWIQLVSDFYTAHPSQNNMSSITDISADFVDPTIAIKAKQAATDLQKKSASIRDRITAAKTTAEKVKIANDYGYKSILQKA
jgi:hypothetical protein